MAHQLFAAGPEALRFPAHPKDARQFLGLGVRRAAGPLLQRIEADACDRIERLDKDDPVREFAVLRRATCQMRHDRIGKIAVHVEKSEAGPVLDVLAYEVFDEVALSHSAEADDGKVRRAQVFLEDHGVSSFRSGRDPQQQILPAGLRRLTPIQVMKQIAYVGKHIWQLWKDEALSDGDEEENSAQ